MHMNLAFDSFRREYGNLKSARHRSWHPICLDSPATLCWTAPVTGMWDGLRSRRESLMRRSRQNLTVITLIEMRELRVYLPASVLDDSEENCRVIARMFPSVTPKQIHRALEGQKLYDRLLTCKNPMKEKVVLGGMHVLGCYDILEGQVMRKKANPACRESTTRLMELYQKALDETPAILENLYQCLYGTGTTLSSRFLRDYH